MPNEDLTVFAVPDCSSDGGLIVRSGTRNSEFLGKPIVAVQIFAR